MGDRGRTMGERGPVKTGSVLSSIWDAAALQLGLGTRGLGQVNQVPGYKFTTRYPNANAPVIYSRDSDFSSITALLKALYCGDLLKSQSTALYKSKFHGVYLRNTTSPALTRYWCIIIECINKKEFQANKVKFNATGLYS